MSKTIKELAVIIIILVILNVTGLLTEVVGGIQRVVLMTGLMNPDIEELQQPKPADYNFSLKTLDGEVIPFEEFKGKTVFLNLWATWCGPCIAEMPNIHSLYEGINSEDIVFVMLSLDDDPQKAKKFIERKEYSFPVYVPANEIPAIYRTGSIPTTHVISPEGNIVFSKKGTANYDSERFRKFLQKQALKNNGI